MNIGRIVAMTKKEARELIRDPVTIAVALLLPLVMLFLFGYAISLDVKDIHFAVWDRDNTRASRELSDAFVHSRYFTFSGSTDMRGASATNIPKRANGLTASLRRNALLAVEPR